MADPVGQIFAQARGGLANGEGFGGFAAQGAQLALQNRRLRLEEEEAQEGRQIAEMARGVFDNFNKLGSTDERLKFITTLAPITLNPRGARLVDTLARVTDHYAQLEHQSLAKQAQNAVVKKQAELAAKYGVDPTDRDGIAWATKAETIEAMIDQAKSLGRELRADEIPDDLFDANGRADPLLRLRTINSAPVTEALDIQRDTLTQRASGQADLSSTRKLQVERAAAVAAGDTAAVQDFDRQLGRIEKDRTKALTEGQAKALNFSERMAYNNRVVEDLMAKGFDPTSVKSEIQDIAPNFMASTEFQQYDAARKNWVAAVLRQESGAAIANSEYANAFEQYFPQLGDSVEVVEQKAKLRKLAEDRMRQTVGDISSDRVTQPQAQVQVRETIDIPSFNDEESARAAGLKTGDIFWIYDPQTGRERKARLK